MILSALLGDNKQKALHFVSALLFISLLFVSGQKVLANRSVGGGRGEEFEAGDNQVHVLVLKVFHDVGHKRIKLFWRYHRSATKIRREQSFSYTFWISYRKVQIARLRKVHLAILEFMTVK